MKLKEFKKGIEKFTLLLVEIRQATTKTDKAYCILTLTDGSKQIQAKLWDMEQADFPIPEKNCIDISLQYQEYNGMDDYTVVKNSYKLNEEAEITDFIKTAPVNPEEAFDYMMDLTMEMPDDLMIVTTKMLMEYKEKILKWSAALKVHHNCMRGWIWHIYRMLLNATGIKNYALVDMNLLYAGIIWHDIGKLLEIETDEMGNSKFTVDGNLFGHPLLGAHLLWKICEETQTEYTENIRLLEHMIISHPGKREFGAIAVPCIPEAEVLHELDMIDARMWQYEEEINELEPGTTSDRKPTLDGAFIYKRELLE